MAVKKNLLLHVTRRFVNVPDALYSKGVSIESNGNDIQFNFDFSPNLKQRGESHQKMDAQDLEKDLHNGRNPSLIEMSLDSQQSYDGVKSSVKNLINLHELEAPIPFYVNYCLNSSYKLKCAVQFIDKYRQVKFSMTE